MLAIIIFTLENYQKTYVDYRKNHSCKNMVLEDSSSGVREKTHSSGNLRGIFIWLLLHYASFTI